MGKAEVIGAKEEGDELMLLITIVDVGDVGDAGNVVDGVNYMVLHR